MKIGELVLTAFSEWPAIPENPVPETMLDCEEAVWFIRELAGKSWQEIDISVAFGVCIAWPFLADEAFSAVFPAVIKAGLEDDGSIAEMIAPMLQILHERHGWPHGMTFTVEQCRCIRLLLIRAEEHPSSGGDTSELRAILGCDE